MAALFLLLSLFPFPIMSGDNLNLAEQEIKVGLIYNFLKYTQWPESDSAQDNIVVCLFDGNPLKEYLQPMKGRTVNQKGITLRIVHDIGDSERCHLLFVGADDKKLWSELRNFLAGKHILTVSDFTGFSDAGGMIEFGHKDNHISVSLNIDVLMEAGLRVQDRLLKLVTIVHTGDNRL